MKKLLFLFFCGNMLFCGNTVFGDDPAERRTKFINEGFGFKYLDDETIDIDLFIARHGRPLHIYEEDVEDIYSDIVNKNITLEYDTLFITFGKWRIWGTNEYSTLLTTIKSKDNCVYLYGIKHGLTVNELEKIIGGLVLGDEAAAYLQYYENAVKIWFWEGKIERIEWLCNLQ